MKFSLGLWKCCLFAICLMGTTVAAGRIALRPLSAREVRIALREVGLEDVIPVGRSVASGLAAIGGFALGITKGIGGSLLYDVATSNATLAYLSSLGGSSSSSSSGSGATAQEICFKSRSVDGDVIQGRDFGEDDEEDELQGRATSPSSPSTPSSPTSPTSPTTPTTPSDGITCIVVQKGRSLDSHRSLDTPRHRRQKLQHRRRTRKLHKLHKRQ